MGTSRMTNMESVFSSDNPNRYDGIDDYFGVSYLMLIYLGGIQDG